MRIQRIEEWFKEIEYCMKESLHPDAKIPFDSDRYVKVGLERLAGFKTELLQELRNREGEGFPPRMTNAQRDRLWTLCGNYKVDFNERDYIIDAKTGWCEGWVGGINHSAGMGSAQTIYVGVSPEGDSHS